MVLLYPKWGKNARLAGTFFPFGQEKTAWMGAGGWNGQMRFLKIPAGGGVDISVRPRI